MDYSFHPHARSELDEALTYYLKVSPRLARGFLSEVENAIGRILQFPQAWAKLSPTIRRCRTKRFPYGIVYKLGKDRVLIVAVMHLHREPNYWADRV